MVTKIVSLGVYQIDFGVKGDPVRVRVMVGGFNHYLGNDGLNPDCFATNRQNDPVRWRERAGIEGWREGKRKFELFAVNFGVGLLNYEEMLKAASADPLLAKLQRGGLPHFQPLFSEEKVRTLYKEHGIGWLEATDENSLWRDGLGRLCAPALDCYPFYRCLRAGLVENGRSADVWFSFVREL